MFMFGGEALIVRSSGCIYFFKQIYDEELEKSLWKSYYKIVQRAFIYYIKGNIRI